MSVSIAYMDTKKTHHTHVHTHTYTLHTHAHAHAHTQFKVSPQAYHEEHNEDKETRPILIYNINILYYIYYIILYIIFNIILFIYSTTIS